MTKIIIQIERSTDAKLLEAFAQKLGLIYSYQTESQSQLEENDDIPHFNLDYKDIYINNHLTIRGKLNELVKYAYDYFASKLKEYNMEPMLNYFNSITDNIIIIGKIATNEELRIKLISFKV
jgi:hypothetical protein